ncbi:potassium channel family protein [Halogeometricum luteum]|uniref:NAD-binding protein n=1 Tax=Halogeometricum luteum TaxID=2950537 RepID=A0ABU2FXA9_9EURY|nr:NAD-binding protein [Halogeometricum sp. S3BR5-2]MDS0293170.1 NAD-binding protein [Halogeometricum sp. S3BR5-2]
MVDGPAETLSRAKRRLVLFLSGVAVLMVGYALVYQWGMATFEGISVPFIDALHVVVETFTTTGYGEDAGQWTSTGMKLITIPMMLSGVTVIFLTLPLFLVPLVEEALRTAPPTETDLTDHVIICSFTSRGGTLVEELASRDVPYVVVESDSETAERLFADGDDVVHGNPESVETLEAANADEAMALVADDDDETNASIILSAKQAAPDLRVISLIEDATLSDYHRYAGADEVVSPRRILGESLARKAASPIATDIDDAVEIGDDFEVAEVLVQRGSALEGDTIAESAIGRRTGVNIIGAWFRGEFVTPPDPDAVVDEHTILLVTGRESQLERLKDLTRSETRRFRRGKVVVAGYGEVGATAADALAAENVPSVVLDERDAPGVDVVGDATNRQALLSADIDEAQSIILALDSDTTAIFATLVIKQVAPETEVIARANDAESIAKLYRAGAEYVLALSTVSGRILASNLTEEEVIAPQSQVEIVRTAAPQIAGQTLAEADVRARTNCTVIAVERDGELLTEVGPEFVVRSADVLVVAGTDEDINRFNVVCG